MGKNDDNKENHLEINQPLLPEDKSDYGVCSDESGSPSSSSSPLSDISTAGLLRVSPNAIVVTSAVASASSVVTAINATPSSSTTNAASSSTGSSDNSCQLPSTSTPSTSSSSSSPSNNNVTNKTTVTISNTIDQITSHGSRQLSAEITNNPSCIGPPGIGSPVLDGETGDSQQALFAPESNKLNFYKRWFFTRQRQSNGSSRSNSVGSTISECGTSTGSGSRKRKMINLSQYNSYIQDERDGKAKLKKREVTPLHHHRHHHHLASRTTTDSNSASDSSGQCVLDSPAISGVGSDLAGTSLPGPSGIHCSSGCCSSDGGCLTASPSMSTSLSRSSSDDHFSFDSDDEMTAFSHSAHAIDMKRKGHSRRRQAVSRHELNSNEIVIGIQKPLINERRCSIPMSSVDHSIEVEQVLNAQALCSSAAPASAIEPSADEQLTVSSCDSRCKKSILLPQLHQDCKRKPTTSASNTNHHLQVQTRDVANTTLAGSVSQLSVASSLFTDPLLPICKICHLNGKEGDPLISPCKCAGTMQFIHCGCLMRWLEISSKKTRKPLSCELCQYQYHWHKKFKVDHLQFPYCSRKDKFLHLLFFFSLCIMIACAVVTVICFKRDRLHQINGHPRAELSDSELSTLICGVLFFLSFFTAMYVQVKARNTLYRLIVKFIYLNQQWYIDEYEKKDTSSPVEV